MPRVTATINTDNSSLQNLEYVLNALRGMNVQVTEIVRGQITGVTDLDVVPEIRMITYVSNVDVRMTVTSPDPDDSDGYYSDSSSSDQSSYY